MPVPTKKSPFQLHVLKWSDCQRCELKDQRNKVVHYRGSIPCNLLFVGEAPGQSEDVIGQPFVGPAGKLLDSIIRDATGGVNYKMGFANLVGCFPRDVKETSNHAPPNPCIKACAPRLAELIALARPEVIVRVGTLALKWTTQLAKEYRIVEANAILVDIPHPAFVLRMIPLQRDQECRRCVARLKTGLESIVPF